MSFVFSCKFAAYFQNTAAFDSLINCVSARSILHLLSIKGECTFSFSNFPITGLCNSSVNSLPEIFSFLIPTQANLFARVEERKLQNIETSPRLYPSYFGFFAIVMLYHAIFYQKFFF